METEIPGEAVEVPGDALVIRFRPTAPEAVFGRAEKEFRRVGRYRLSVFAALRAAGETDAELEQRLLKVADLSGMNPADHPKYYVCARAEELQRRGLVFYKDRDDDEMDEHYSVDLGTDSPRENVEKFLEAFGPAQRR
jgi:hypothetical protein